MAETEIKNKVQYLPTGKLKLHPDNPRLIKDRDFDILCQSIQENPGYFEARPLLCTPDFVVFAGNMRLRAAKHLKLKQVPVVVMDIDREKVRELMIRDNIQSGQWDTEALASSFEVEELKAWGIADFVFGEPVGDNMPGAGISPDELTDGFSLPSGDKEPFQQMTFTLADVQAETIKRAIQAAKQTSEYETSEMHGNENTNGNALYLIVTQWAEQRT